MAWPLLIPTRCPDPPPTPRGGPLDSDIYSITRGTPGLGTTLCGIQVTSDALWASVAGDERIGTRVSGPSCASAIILVWSLGWKPRRSRRTAGSPHPLWHLRMGATASSRAGSSLP